MSSPPNLTPGFLQLKMPVKPLSFDSQEYWNSRFTSNPDPFEWLASSDALDPYLAAALNSIRDPEPSILHVGCGTSLLSYHLRKHVLKPEQIHNVDYSDVAIEIGQKKEAEIVNSASGSTTNSSKMRWTSANLLDYSSFSQACQPSAYALVVEKSTSDSISCADDVDIPLPYYIHTSSDDSLDSRTEKTHKSVHPLHLMAVHLALVTKPGGRWVSLSYSTDRYPFLDTSASDKDLPPGSNDGLPDPNRLWKIVGRYNVEPLLSENTTDKSEPGLTHKPKVLHWVYVMERTNLELHIRDSHL